MPTLGFPAAWNLSVHLAEVPMLTRADALALHPEWFGEGDDAIRDTMADGWVEAWAKYASKLAARAAETNELYATSASLDYLGAQKGLPRAFGEETEDYRARLLSNDDAANPRALLAAIDRITARATTKLAYLYVRPLDEAFVYSKSHAFSPPRGTFVGAKQPIRKVRRVYALRGRSAPRHIILWNHKREAGGAFTDPGSPFIYAIRIFDTDDYNGACNGNAHAILGLPASLQPNRIKRTDCFVFAKIAVPIDAGGSLVPEAVQRGRIGAFVFAKATAVTRLGAGKVPNPMIRRRNAAATFIVNEIKALLAARASFGVTTTLLFDSSL